MRRYNNIDTSQHQNFQRFRNERRNGEPFLMSSQFFDNVRHVCVPCMLTVVLPHRFHLQRQLPSAGQVEFDYVPAKRVSRRSGLPLVWSQLLSKALKAGLNVVLEMAAMELNELHVTANEPVPFLLDDFAKPRPRPDWVGPPEFLSPLSKTPNEFPVPPYKQRCVGMWALHAVCAGISLPMT